MDFNSIPHIESAGDIPYMRFAALNAGDFIAFYRKETPQDIELFWVSESGSGGSQCGLQVARSNGHLFETTIHRSEIGDFKVMSRDVPEDMIRNFVEFIMSMLASASEGLDENLAALEGRLQMLDVVARIVRR